MHLFYLEHLSVSVIHFMSYCDTAPFAPLASCPCPCSSNVPFPRMGSPSSAWLMPPGFQSFPISKSVTILQDLTGDFLFLYGTRTLLMQFFRVTKAVSAQSPLQCQNSPQVSLCPLQLLISIQIPATRGCCHMVSLCFSIPCTGFKFTSEGKEQITANIQECLERAVGISARKKEGGLKGKINWKM